MGIGIGKIDKVEQKDNISKIKAEVLKDEIVIGRMLQQFGFKSIPQKGTDAILLFPRGDRSNSLIIATEDKNIKIDLQTGETAIFASDGAKIVLKKNNEIEITGNITVSGNIKIEGDVEANNVNGTSTVKGGTVQTSSGVGLGTHIHVVPLPDAPPTNSQVGLG